MGVKQGSLISPLVFSLFINDLFDELDGAINIAGLKIKLLANADDAINLADHIVTAHEKERKSYFKKCNLQVHLNKSKIVIFKPHSGKIAKKKKSGSIRAI